MKIYFYGPETSRRELLDHYEVIAKVLKRNGVLLSSNVARREVNLPAEDIAQAEASGQPLLDQMDALVIDGTISDQQAGYLVAFAITTRKPTLFLYTRGIVPELFKHLTTKEIPRWLTVTAYLPKNLETKVEAFLGTVQGAKVREVPRIKFTLRITKSIEQYLAFKTNNTKLTKADWLRAEIEKLMENDSVWRKFRHGPDTE